MTRMQTPPNTVTIRMYRQGHGDCFLLAFPGSSGDDPAYVLIDCGYKPGSQKFIHKRSIKDTVDHIAESTGRHLNLVVITHEHQDHVNGFWKQKEPYFGDFTIDEAWFAWTEDPLDELANELRQRHRDQLLGLVEARRQLDAFGADGDAVARLDALLSLEVGGEDDAFDLETFRAAGDPAKSKNKQAMKLVKDKAAARNGVRYLSPGGERHVIPGTFGHGAYVLGPPRDPDLLADEDPVDSEAFPDAEHAVHQGFSFSAAVQAGGREPSAPFDPRYQIPKSKAAKKPFFKAHYDSGKPDDEAADETEVSDNASFRRIDAEWLYAAENLALKLNRGINNTSLVLAFELPRSRKVLLFAADAQRGNWLSWDDSAFSADDPEVTARDLLARTVLYKVGHHGSHNATLAGNLDDSYPNLSWMAQGAAASEFTAMITAVNQWALTKNNPPWRHPLPAIRDTLLVKTQGRLFQTDAPPGDFSSNLSEVERDAFLSRIKTDELYYDLVIRDE